MRFRAFERDPHRAYRTESFYTRVFGWDFSPFQGPEDFWPLGFDSAAETENAAPSNQKPIRTISQPIAVVSLEEATLRIVNQGGRVLSAPIAIPGTGYLVYCQDAEGHPFGILESDSIDDEDEPEDEENPA